jgi:hypothetical protein
MKYTVQMSKANAGANGKHVNFLCKVFFNVNQDKYLY